MLYWPDEFCAALVDRGFAVARFDNRDAGLSTHLMQAGVPSLGPLPGVDAKHRRVPAERLRVTRRTPRRTRTSRVAPRVRSLAHHRDTSVLIRAEAVVSTVSGRKLGGRLTTIAGRV